jgi:hypothetical protein
MAGRSVAEIVSGLGVSALARAFGHENLSTVSSWKSRGNIPVEYWPKLIEHAAMRGIALSGDELIAAHALRPSASNKRGPETTGTAA